MSQQQSYSQSDVQSGLRLQSPPIDQPRPVAGPRPVGPEAGPGGVNWGPYPPRSDLPRSNLREASQTITSPLQMLSGVADHAHKLNAEMLGLVTAITGEAPPSPRLRQSPAPGGGFLPAVASIAHEIEVAHVEIARLIRHLRGQL